MARVKLSEWKAKQLISDECKLTFASTALLKGEHFSYGDADKLYVVKVDQGVKKRFKNGLVKLQVKGSAVEQAVEELASKGYEQFIVEPFVKYEQKDERYLSLERIREGVQVLYSKAGGVNVEDQAANMQSVVVKSKNEMDLVAQYLEMPSDVARSIYQTFENNYFSFLEINPLVVFQNIVYLLDTAGEVDSIAQFFVQDAWSADHIVSAPAQTYEEEQQVAAIAERSQAALTLKVLNPNGAIFLLLSGGGASIVLADEICDRGYGHEIANYGEYSGNPSTEETYLYTKSLLSLLVKSTAAKKVLVIGGGVANFTDIRKTFKGVIQALEEASAELVRMQVKVYVRRGGPYQDEGLQHMREFLNEKKILGAVMGPDEVLTKAVTLAVEHLKG